ncbi:MAG: TrpB-like pyridoxal phosphate-dependent enzyme [Dethiobacteria bacterium]|jgi:tryptophan synthase beta chain
MKLKKITLPEQEIPRRWYNIQADMPNPLNPPLNPATGKPISPEDLAPIFPLNLIEQEVSTEQYIEIPEEVLEKLLFYRPTPLKRAYNLEKYLGTPAKIYYKDESVSPAGSHKPNTAIAQAYYNKVFGIKKLTTETGAGQWGSALAFACSQFGLECKVYMVRVSYEQKPYRRLMMQAWGGNCIPSPSRETNFGRKILASDPNCPGSLGIAISEAIEEAVEAEDTRYSLGSVLNHVMLHQTIIGLETQKQFAAINEYPDIVIGCVGGGSNFAGLAFPFVRDKIYGKDLRIIGVEPTACPTLTRGQFAYDFGDTAAMTPLLAMHTLGHKFLPPSIHAGGLRYHGISPLVSQLLRDGLLEAEAYDQLKTYEAGVTWARTEGGIPAPETCHAIAASINEALKAKEEAKEKIIVFNYSGHGLLDLPGYASYFEGKLTDFVLPEEGLEKSLAEIKGYPPVK